MNRTLDFFMAMEPPTVTAQEHKVVVKNGKPVFYDPPQVKAAKAKLMAHLGKHIPQQAFIGPVRLTVKWCFPQSPAHPAWTWRTTKPDTDNLQKLLKDCMTRCEFWHDDAQVVSEITEKFWAELPGIYLRIEELED